MYFLSRKNNKNIFFSICPISPCKASEGSQKKLGIPTLEKVAEIFLAIKPDFPIPAKITFTFTI